MSLNGNEFSIHSCYQVVGNDANNLYESENTFQYTMLRLNLSTKQLRNCNMLVTIK